MDTETTTASTGVLAAFPDHWQRRHLLDIESLSAEELLVILRLAEEFKQYINQTREKLTLLKGKTCANIFFENSIK